MFWTRGARSPRWPRPSANCVVVAGATARLGLYRQHVRTPREVAPELVKPPVMPGSRWFSVARTRAFSNEEIGMCTHLIRIPTAPAYISLNLAQSVMVCCYELFIALGDYEARRKNPSSRPPVTASSSWKCGATCCCESATWSRDKADHMMQGFQRIFTRGAVTEDDIHMLMGVARQAEWAANKTPPAEK